MILAHTFPVGITTREVTINQDMKALLPLYSETRDFLLVALPVCGRDQYVWV